ncbi:MULTISPECIES: hypothetical protein [Paenibacillus]|jgi:hypothetical protein|uniref:hypothetical protein n=1 Tax=Paenibacillus TaxID=44249 RepID=UPI00240E0AC6|nr:MULTISPECIES: hypothetical protein [Paenibacillus]MCI1777676.1 hypothetical protein [Paenibacillus lautus]WFB57614.1 hypothetical protein P0X86_27210 [Paenibacillus sp. BR1-192]
MLGKAKSEFWPPEKLAAHLKAIGADKPPEPRNIGLKYEITAPRKGYRNKYLKRGGEY